MLNVEKYRKELSEGIGRLECQIHDLRKKSGCTFTNFCADCRAESIKWLCSEYTKPSLTKEETDYLIAVIKPFRKFVMYMVKSESEDGWEKIVFYSENPTNWECVTELPPFQSGTKFKAMELGKIYTPNELKL